VVKVREGNLLSSQLRACIERYLYSYVLQRSMEQILPYGPESMPRCPRRLQTYSGLKAALRYVNHMKNLRTNNTSGVGMCSGKSRETTGWRAALCARSQRTPVQACAANRWNTSEQKVTHSLHLSPRHPTHSSESKYARESRLHTRGTCCRDNEHLAETTGYFASSIARDITAAP
jgi:hypothetical protein